MAVSDGAELLAAFDARTGEFADLVLSDADGLSFRDKGTWADYQPGDTSLDGKEIVEVSEDFVGLVDARMGRGITREDAKRHEAYDGEADE